MVPHGMAVSLTAPEAFRFTFDAAPERHLRAAELLAPGRGAARRPGRLPARVLCDLMRDIGIPAGIGAVGYGEGDVDDLVEGARQQQRLLAIAPAGADRRRPGRDPARLASSCGEPGDVQGRAGVGAPAGGPCPAPGPRARGLARRACVLTLP